MNKLYMGLDIGSVMIKGIIIDSNNNIIASACRYIAGDPIKASKLVVDELHRDIDDETSEVVAIGCTGGARKLIGTLLGAVTIKNEVIAEAIGTVSLYPNVKTILEIGGKDNKIILLNDGIVTDYGINTSCMSGIGLFIDDLAKKFNINILDVANLALSSKHKIKIASRCMIFAENDLLQKLQMGYKKEDILAGVCQMIASSYLNNVAKGKKILSPIVFNGGVSKNMAIHRELESMLGEKIIVNKNGHFMGALGIAIMARDSKKEKIFDFNIDNYKLETRMTKCINCANNCEIVTIFKNDKLIQYWGNRCDDAIVLKNV